MKCATTRTTKALNPSGATRKTSLVNRQLTQSSTDKGHCPIRLPCLIVQMALLTIQRNSVADSISNLLRNYNCDSKRLVNVLLKQY